MKNTRNALIGSVAMNIFLAGFLLGKICMPGFMHHPRPEGHGPLSQQESPFEGRGEGPGGPHVPGPNEKEGRNGPPPPFFSPMGLFTAEEMKTEFSQMQEKFSRVDKMRTDFAEKLKTTKVSKEEVLSHFAELDSLMSEIRKATQEKAATKISTLPDEERTKVAQRMLEHAQKRAAERFPK